MKTNLQVTETGVNKRMKKGNDDVGVQQINGNIQDEYTDTKMLKRKLNSSKDEKAKKKKKENSEESFINGTYNSEIEHSKLVEGIEDNNEVENKKEDENDKETNHLDVKFLRKNLNSERGLDVLKRFVKICNENKGRDLAAEYLNEGGNIVEVIKLLGTDKKGIGSAVTVFSAVRILLIKILTQCPQYQSSAEGACRYLINSHLSLIYSMLSVQSNTKQRKVVLQLLAAIVSLGGTVPRELFSHLSLPLEVIKSLVQHTKPTDDQNIRNCYIHFVIAFLVEGSVPIIRVLLDKRDLLTNIFPGLIYDSKDIVALVLTTLKKYVLQNTNISKTMKLQIFSTSVIQNLVCLYNWKGPNNWRDPKNKVQTVIQDEHYFEEKEIVIEVIHDFLITLLTSHRHGIIFRDRMLGISHVKHNYTVNTILQSLDRPWEHEKPSDLVIKIMAACPDLVRSQFNLLEPYIEPRASLKWIAAIKFIRKIIQSVDVEVCIKTSLELNTSQLANALASLTLPGVILKQAIMPSLIHSNIIVRHEAVLTLMIMFNQIRKCLTTLTTAYKGDSFHSFKHFITEYTLKNIPNLNTILKAWSCAFTSDSIDDTSKNELIPEPKRHEHLMAILDLLHMYNEVCPKLLDTLSDLQVDGFLSILNTLDDVGVDEFNTIKVKAINFLVMLSPNEFLPHKKIFKDTLSFLISVLHDETSSVTLHSKMTIKTLLNATGMFEGCQDHLDIWVNGFINIDKKNKVTKWFVRIVKETTQDIEKYVNEIIRAEEVINEEIVNVGRLESIFDELMNKPSISENFESNNALPMQRFASVSPLLCCVLHKMKEDLHPSILSYVSYVLIHTLHYQVTPQCLIHLTKDIEGLLVKEYLLSWLESNQPVYIKETLSSTALMSKLNSAFLSDTKLQVNEILDGDRTVTFQYNEETITIRHSLSIYEITYLFKMTTFYLTQFTKRGTLTKCQAYNYRIFFILLLHIAKDSTDSSLFVEECARTIFTHPAILHYFSPLQKSEDTVKSIITFTVLDVCKVVTNLCAKAKVKNLFVHFKNKLFTQLCKMIEKKRKSERISEADAVITLLEVLQLTPRDILHLLREIVKLESIMFISKDENNLSMYGHLVPTLLKIINTNEMKSERSAFFELDAKFVKDLCVHLFFFKSSSVTNVEIWETALHAYLSNFPFNIAGIDTNIFISLLSTKITDATVDLISFLTNKNTKFIPNFVKYMMKSESIKMNNIVLSVIASNLDFKWNPSFLQSLKNNYEAEILSYMCNPKDDKPWIQKNISAVCYLIKTQFDLKTCNETCNAILQIGDRLDMVPIHYIELLQSMCSKCVTSNSESEILIMNLTQVLLHVITLTLKKESKNTEKLIILCEALDSAINCLKSLKEDFVFEGLSTNHSWAQFTRFSLKFGLKGLKSNEERVPILKTLSTACDIAYKNDSNNDYVKTLFEMSASHSEFINIMLGSSDTKRYLLELLWILMRKNKTVMTSTHVPVYLAAYNATLNEADQYILLILQYYESNDINIYDYRPYVWGSAAAMHYSVKGETATSLWRQPSVAQVLNLFEEDIVNNTIRNYPVDRALKSNELCKGNDIYDPAFYLPLLSFLLSENNVVHCQKVAQSGALALALAACSSKHSDVRMVAYTTIARYYTHLEASRSKAKLLWMRLIDVMRYGIVSLQTELNSVRVNCLISTFLARTSLIATQPLHPLYSVLQTFLMAKPALDLNTIPELLQLFHSSDVQHKAHRNWILENIRDGIKTESELNVAFKCVLFKMLLDFYSCILSDLNTKRLILEIIDAVLEITKAATLLMEHHGLLPWLLEVAGNLNKHDSRSIELVVKIMDKLLKTMGTKGDGMPYKLMLLNVAFRLKSHLVSDINISTFTLYVNILQKLFLSKQIRVTVTKEDIIEVVEFSKRLSIDVEECEDMLRFGCGYITEINCRKDGELQIARNALRTLVWTWCGHKV
ncbi:nucleolar pre-ribosomal-associated protein 1 [Ceratina calcarata]|uniref:Nucleolar pre-ribosomal-associated protein 1 n=1 Tax=Ceratina calcarata TaxID=156304 RepID=A0AAJ7IVJ4_9HYME|nr:nucleolar pre-ribosomal-associated protein 1 [Ceratina calcarata]